VDIPQAVLDAPPPWRSKLCNDKKVLLYLGRIHPKKGLLNLLAALDIVRKKGSRNIASWVVALAGWDQLGHEGELKRRVKDLGLDEKVIFLGPQFAAQKVACYASADAFVLPSLSEGLPMVVLEAWAHGLPVLMTAECNIPEGFEAGAAIPIEASPERIASGLQTLFSMTDAERKDSGLRGLALVTDRFAWPRIAEDMKAVYEWLVGGGVRPSCVSQE
jgi:poly(glycerol-phosphate) alpha-glucosyltransferase